MVVGQSTLDGSLLLGPTGWRVSSVARQEAKTANGEAGRDRRESGRCREQRAETQRGEKDGSKEASGGLSAWLAGQREAEAERRQRQSEWESEWESEGEGE